MAVPHRLSFERHRGGEAETVEAEITRLVIAGWTGKDKAAMEAHMAELEEIGIKRPPHAPVFYHLAADLLTTADRIQVTGAETSGEVEYFVLALEDGLWMGVGSDHTDRAAETYDITISKQTCAKPVAPVLWRYDDVIGHWDKLVLRSHAVIDGRRVLYQEGPVTGMLPAEELIGRRFRDDGDLPTGTLMYCGTLAVHGGVRPGSAFEIEIEDTDLGRKITHRYEIDVLPPES